jgi:hypothetical protein
MNKADWLEVLNNKDLPDDVDIAIFATADAEPENVTIGNIGARRNSTRIEGWDGNQQAFYDEGLLQAIANIQRHHG